MRISDANFDRQRFQTVALYKFFSFVQFQRELFGTELRHGYQFFRGLRFVFSGDSVYKLNRNWSHSTNDSGDKSELPANIRIRFVRSSHQPSLLWTK